jgi:hypothetical protein
MSASLFSPFLSGALRCSFLLIVLASGETRIRLAFALVHAGGLLLLTVVCSRGWNKHCHCRKRYKS